MHCVFVIERNAFEGEEAVEGEGKFGAADFGTDNSVEVALGETIGLVALLVADVGKDKLIIEFPRGYGRVFNFILAETVAAVVFVVVVCVPNDSCSGSGSLIPSVVGVDQPKASTSGLAEVVSTERKRI